MKKKDVHGTAIINGEVVPFQGSVEFEQKHENSIYASWKIFDAQGKIIASLSKEYYMDSSNNKLDDIFNFILEMMKKYRIGRKYIISEIKLN